MQSPARPRLRPIRIFTRSLTLIFPVSLAQARRFDASTTLSSMKMRERNKDQVTQPSRAASSGGVLACHVASVARLWLRPARFLRVANKCRLNPTMQHSRRRVSHDPSCRREGRQLNPSSFLATAACPVPIDGSVC